MNNYELLEFKITIIAKRRAGEVPIASSCQCRVLSLTEKATSIYSISRSDQRGRL